LDAVTINLLQKYFGFGGAIVGVIAFTLLSMFLKRRARAKEDAEWAAAVRMGERDNKQTAERAGKNDEKLDTSKTSQIFTSLVTLTITGELDWRKIPRTALGNLGPWHNVIPNNCFTSELKSGSAIWLVCDLDGNVDCRIIRPNGAVFHPADGQNHAELRRLYTLVSGTNRE